MVERRRYRRYHVREDASAVIHAEAVKLVPMVNVSRGGLGIEKLKIDDGLNQTSKLETLISDYTFFLDSLPLNLALSFRPSNRKADLTPTIWRYGVKFKDLIPR
jgi:hypothetical protein